MLYTTIVSIFGFFYLLFNCKSSCCNCCLMTPDLASFFFFPLNFFVIDFVFKFCIFLFCRGGWGDSFCRTDLKFCSCSDDTTVKVWDFARCQEDCSLSGNVPCLLQMVNDFVPIWWMFDPTICFLFSCSDSVYSSSVIHFWLIPPLLISFSWKW